MRKDNQGGRRRRSNKPPKAEPKAFNQAMQQIAGWTAAMVDSPLLPISRALSDTTHKAQFAQQAGSLADFDRLASLLTQQRMQITMAEPQSSMDVLVMASTAIWLASALPNIDSEEGTRFAVQELVCTLGAIRRFHEAQIGITSEALGLDGRPLEQ